MLQQKSHKILLSNSIEILKFSRRVHNKDDKSVTGTK